MARFTVIYDACCLYPAPLRDFLMELATRDLFRAKWSRAIHDEWTRNVLANRPDLTREQLERTCALMDSHAPDCLVEGYEYLVPALTLPDPDDRHVLAAAIHARADAIITFNLGDFPAEELARHHVEAIHPDDFISDQFDLQQAEVVTAAVRHRARLRNPPKSATEYLDTLLAQSLPKTVALLRPFAAVL
ncbi:PIN domain-containing protein [Aerophototrophica crusticola]|uniref:PIN domain-containing protein n=1 Tax=Aerophototrophica crusticola TaxID=1709002 RepID=A0A858RBE2_9PROT|nr:PIN domain-containing protein [Rhodospirillaceae bacterium B3]